MRNYSVYLWIGIALMLAADVYFAVKWRTTRRENIRLEAVVGELRHGTRYCLDFDEVSAIVAERCEGLEDIVQQYCSREEE